VIDARERQATRLRDDGVTLNAQMDSRMLRAHAALAERDEQLLARARERGTRVRAASFASCASRARSPTSTAPSGSGATT
jgi:predicted ATPase with chaperone activity